jgi:hypothetical protein
VEQGHGGVGVVFDPLQRGPGSQCCDFRSFRNLART